MRAARSILPGLDQIPLRITDRDLLSAAAAAAPPPRRSQAGGCRRWQKMVLWLGLALALAGPAAASCVPPGGAADQSIAVPGHPFGIASTTGGCHVFVTMPAAGTPPSPAGTSVLRWRDGKLVNDRTAPYGGLGAKLTHDGTTLITADRHRVLLLDVARLTDGDADPLVGTIELGPNSPEHQNPEAIYVAMTRDDRLLFVSCENLARITVIDLARARRGDPASEVILGHIPVGPRPIAVTLSQDDRYLFTTSQYAEPELGWPARCAAENAAGPTPAPAYPEGAVAVIDVATAATTPERAVLARVPAGCNPVRLALSPDGAEAWVTARSNDAVIVFATAHLISDPDHAKLGTVPVGRSPVGVVVTGNGRQVWVANSGRFSSDPEATQWLTVINTAKNSGDSFTVAGRVQAGAFPRETHILDDGRTLLISNFQSRTVQVIDTSRARP